MLEDRPPYATKSVKKPSMNPVKRNLVPGANLPIVPLLNGLSETLEAMPSSPAVVK